MYVNSVTSLVNVLEKNMFIVDKTIDSRYSQLFFIMIHTLHRSIQYSMLKYLSGSTECSHRQGKILNNIRVAYKYRHYRTFAANIIIILKDTINDHMTQQI